MYPCLQNISFQSSEKGVPSKKGSLSKPWVSLRRIFLQCYQQTSLFSLLWWALRYVCEGFLYLQPKLSLPTDASGSSSFMMNMTSEEDSAAHQILRLRSVWNLFLTFYLVCSLNQHQHCLFWTGQNLLAKRLAINVDKLHTIMVGVKAQTQE